MTVRFYSKKEDKLIRVQNVERVAMLQACPGGPKGYELTIRGSDLLNDERTWTELYPLKDYELWMIN